MSKICPYYNCIVLSQDCVECDEKYCRYIKARKAKIKSGDIFEVETMFGHKARFMYLGKYKINRFKSKRILYRFNRYGNFATIILVDHDFFKLKKFEILRNEKDSSTFDCMRKEFERRKEELCKNIK